MKSNVLDSEGKKIKQIELPKCFNDEVRSDLIKRAFEASVRRQPYGAFYLAGKLVSASGRVRHARRKYKTAYGIGISRVPRKVMTRRGTQFYWVGAYAPGMKGGRAAHPPKAEKIWLKKVNKKERIKAIRAAIAATANLKMLIERYKTLAPITEQLKNFSFPIIVDSKTLNANKTKIIFETLKKVLGPLTGIAMREKEIRAGQGKKRGRKYKISRGLLIISEKKLPIAESLKGHGIDAITVRDMNITQLAPAGIAGRLAIYTEDAINEINKMKNLKD